MKVYYLGPQGTFTYQAAKQHFSNFSDTDIDFVPVLKLPEIPSSLSQHGDYAVIPFENSSNGHVVPTLDMLRLENRCQVVAEIYLTVHQCLLVHPSLLQGDMSEAPLTTALSKVRRIYSHLQAFGQCERFLKQHFPAGVERVSVDSTGKAAALAAVDLESAAIASAASASPTTDTVIAQGEIEDIKHNTTRFLVLALATEGKQVSSAGSGEKTLMRFTVAHDEPGSLALILAGFAQGGVNLTSISSRPVPVVPLNDADEAIVKLNHWRYVFFIECKGGKDDERVRKAIANAANHAQSFRVMGTFQDIRHPS
ncbi:prephenate dehydratase [Savitreella phatthalungensis]